MQRCFICSLDIEYGIRIKEYVFCSIECFSRRFIQLESLKRVMLSSRDSSLPS